MAIVTVAAISSSPGAKRSCLTFAVPSRSFPASLSFPTTSFPRRFHHLSRVSLSAAPVADNLLQNLCRAAILQRVQPEKISIPPLLARRILLCILLSIPLSITTGVSLAAVDDSIKASRFGLNVATALRASGWIDEAIVFFLATLPVIELRGAIPVGYWMRLDPLKLTIVSVLGYVPTHCWLPMGPYYIAMQYRFFFLEYGAGALHCALLEEVCRLSF
ncbi:hypothetical protein HPP92_018248 [Vanilla planifolia]|uniref:Uncharacterized protein n=1 Tax=Vanilla planifolia TaxID=51239 RepID=A0A835Q9G2_VANPL|nr:hypothetical protein HPP92_018248 [Vanilla planifolia]